MWVGMMAAATIEAVALQSSLAWALAALACMTASAMVAERYSTYPGIRALLAMGCMAIVGMVVLPAGDTLDLWPSISMALLLGWSVLGAVASLLAEWRKPELPLELVWGAGAVIGFCTGVLLATGAWLIGIIGLLSLQFVYHVKHYL